MKENRWLTCNWLVAAVIFWYFLSRRLSQLIFVSFDRFSISIYPFIRIFLETVLIPYGLSLIIVYLVVLPLKRYPFHDKKHLNIKELMNYLVVINGLGMFMMLLLLMMAHFMGVLENPEKVNAGSPTWMDVILLLLLNPIVEGFFFRKLLLERVPDFHIYKRSLVGGLIFALPHIFSQGVIVGLRTFVIGSLLAYVTIDTGSLKYAAILHSLSNVYGYFLLNALLDYPVLFLLCYFVIMPAWAIYIVRQYFKTN